MSDCPTLINLGLPRTGTTSLHAALEKLGVRGEHPGEQGEDKLASLSSAALRMTPDASAIDVELTAALTANEAVGCWPWSFVAATSPQALRRATSVKLISTTRSVESWVPSAQWLFEDPLFRYGHPAPVIELLRGFFGGSWPPARAELVRAFRRHDAAVRSLNASLISLDEPPPARWRALCAALLAPPACPVLRSMADCPADAPWPLRSERHNNLEVLGLSGEQARALGLLQQDDAESSAAAALDEEEQALQPAELPHGAARGGDLHPGAGHSRSLGEELARSSSASSPSSPSGGGGEQVEGEGDFDEDDAAWEEAQLPVQREHHLTPTELLRASEAWDHDDTHEGANDHERPHATAGRLARRERQTA